MDVCVDLQARSLGRAPGVADGVSCLMCVCHGRLLWVVAASPPSYPSTPPPFPRRLVLGNVPGVVRSGALTQTSVVVGPK